jgi:hypothetical protein
MSNRLLPCVHCLTLVVEGQAFCHRCGHLAKERGCFCVRCRQTVKDRRETREVA